MAGRIGALGLPRAQQTHGAPTHGKPGISGRTACKEIAMAATMKRMSLISGKNIDVRGGTAVGILRRKRTEMIQSSRTRTAGLKGQRPAWELCSKQHARTWAWMSSTVQM